MDELVVLIIFGVIILFNFILKKLAGKAYERGETDEFPAGETDGESGEVAPSRSAPLGDVRDFIEEIKRRSEGTPAGQRPNQYQRSAQGGETSEPDARTGQLRRDNSETATARKSEKPSRSKESAKASSQKSLSKQSAVQKRKKTPAPFGDASGRKRKSPPGGRSGLVGRNRSELRRAVVMSEVLGKPVGLRDHQKSK